MGTSRSTRPAVPLAACALAVLLICSSVYAEDKCTAGCHGASAPSPAFVDGTTYTYNLESVVSIFLTSADKQETSLKVTGQASVTALGNCAHVLRVQNLVIAGPDGKKHAKPAGIEKTVRFTIQDGQVGSSICTEAGDNQRSINIKRAIISLLQNAQKQNTEVDVFGVCPTDINAQSENGVTTIHKTRDLNLCAHREQGKHDLLTAIYNPHAEIKSSHLLQSILNVESRLKAGVVERAVATEEYLYRPFSVGQNGARAKVVTKLSLSGHAKGNEAAKPNIPKSIIFENPHPVATEHSNVANVLLSLKSAAQSLESKAGEKSASIFAGLVKVLRVTNKDDLLNVYAQIKSGGAVKDNDLAKRVYLDALLRSGTGDAIEASIKLLQDKELNAIEQRIVFLSLSNARHASPESLKAATTLLDQPNLPREVYLGVGALAGAYCREHACHGEKSQSEAVAALTQKLSSRLQGCKPKTKADEDVVVAVLKGLRNIRHIEDSLVDKLVQCVSGKDVKPRVKVAALETIHADPCIPKLKHAAIDILKNRQLDSEIRIKAYLALLDCPCSKVANEIKTLLTTEPVQQVGRFIVSSLRAIKASANPDRQAAKQHLGLIHTPNRFSVDDRRYSHFHELSYSIDSLGAGASYEHSVIFSQNSFIPRSANLNLTAEVFGHSVNFLELGVRQGNLDRVLEHYVGPKGYLRTTEPQKIYDDTLEKVLAVVEKFKERLNAGPQRSRRNVKLEVAAFTKQIKNELEAFSGNVELDVFVKLFGTDAIFLALGDDHLSLSGIVDKLFDQLDSGLNKAKQFSHEFRNHLLFLDAELAYPTAVGVPLKLSVQGASTVKLGFGANVDLRRIIQDPNNAKIDIEIVPSANIEISSYIYADANIVSTGLKVFSTLHTSTGSHLVAKVLENGKGIDIQLGLPVEKQELLTINHELVFTSSEKGQQETDVALKFEVDRKEYRGCFDQLSGALGLIFCGEVSLPWVTEGPNAGQSLQKLATRFPYSGPARLSVKLEKDDLKGFHLKGLLNDKDQEKRTFELVFEAEGSKNNRRTSFVADLTNRQTEKGLKVEIKSPYKNVDAHALLLNTDREKSLSLRLQSDDNEYFAKLGAAVSGSPAKRVYTPLIEYRNPKQQNKAFNVEGEIVVDQINGGSKYNFNSVRFVNANEKLQVDGYVSQGSDGISTDLKVVQGKQQGSLKGKLQLTQNGAKVNLEFHNSLNPNIDFSVQYHGIKEEGHVQNDLVLVLGPDSKSSSRKLTINQNLKYHGKDASDFDVITKNKVSYPELDLEIEADGEFNPKKVDVDIESKYGKTKAEFEIEARADTKKKGDYSVKFEGKVNENGIEVLSKRDIIDEDKSNWQNSLVISRGGGRYELNGVVTHRVKPSDVNVGVVGHLKVAGRPDDYKVDVGVIANPTTYASHAKFTVGAADYLDYVLKVNKGPAPTGSLKLFFKGVVNAQGQFKGNRADGKGNAVLIVDLLRVQRKLKLDTNYVCLAPQFNGNVDLYLDFEKDNNNKIVFNTVSTAQDHKNYDSKSSIAIRDQKVNVHLKSESTGTWENGKNLRYLEIVLPSGRVLTFKGDRTLDGNNKEKQNGQIELLASDAKQRGAETSKVQFVGKITDLNAKALTFTHDGHLVVSLSSGKNLDVVTHTQNLPSTGSKKNLEHKLDITGNLIPKPLSVSLSSDHSEEENRRDGKYRLKATYGSDIGIDGNGRLSIEKVDGLRKYDSDLTLSVLLPFEKAHDIKLTLTEGLSVPIDNKGSLEGSTALGLQVNADAYKLNGNFKCKHEGGGQAKIKILVPHHEPVSVETNYLKKDEGLNFERNAELKVVYGANKQLSLNVAGIRKSDVEYNGKVHLILPQNDKVNDIAVDLTHSHAVANTHKSLILVTVDGKVWKVDNVVVVAKNSPSFELKVASPDKPVARIYSKASIISEKQFTSEVKLENVRGVNAESALDVNIISPEEFVIKVDVNSEKLNLKNVHVEASTKGKTINLLATSEGKNLLSGSTSYLKKQEGGKTIVEGSGTVTVKEEQKAISFKYLRELINEPTEQGFEVFFKTEIGQKSFLIEHKVTNVEYKLNNVYCEEKKQCANAEFSSKLNKQNPDQLQHSLQVLVDLRKLGLSPEFGLQSNADLHRNKLPVATFDVYLNQDKSKYHLHAYSQPAKGSLPIGITLNLPQRVISLEHTLTYPDGKPLPLPLRGEVALYLNKKGEPNQKASLRFNADFQRIEQKSVTALGDIVFSHPALGKDLQISGKSVYDTESHSVSSNLILDIFKKKNQRVTVTGKWNANIVQNQSVNITAELDISGKGLGIELAAAEHLAISREEVGAGVNVVFTQDKQKREAGVTLHASKQNLRLQVKAPGVTLINVDGNFQLTKEAQVADLTVTLLQDKPVFLHTQIKSLQSFEISTGYKNVPENKLSISGRVVPHERIEWKAEIVKGNERKDLAHAAVFVQDHVLKNDVGISTENIKTYVEHVKSDVKALLDRTKQVSSQLSGLAKKDAQRIGQILKGAAPDFAHLGQAYKAELEKIRDELVNDKTLQEINQFVKNLIQTLAKIFSDLLTNVTDIVEKTTKFLSDFIEKVSDVINEKVIPQVKELVHSVVEIATDAGKAVVDYVAHYVVLVTDFLEKHKDEFKELTTAVNDLSRDVSKLIGKRLAQIKNDLDALIEKLKEQIRTLPAVQLLKEKWAEFTLPEQLLPFLTEGSNALKAILPGEELKALVDVVVNYLEKKIKQEKVDDSAEIRAIYQKLVVAVNFLLEQAKGVIGDYNLSTFNGWNLLTPVSWVPGVQRLPGVGSVSFSILNYLRGEHNSFADYLKSYKSLGGPGVGWVPPFKGRAQIVDGGHIFTFDGRHLTFPGTCKYVLSHDSADGNFTVAAVLNNGVIKSIILVDKEGLLVEVKDNGQLWFNGANHGYPVDNKEITAWRDWSGINIVSFYGVRIRCLSNLKVCQVEVSGFYFGRTRGLLGDLNNEPFDDFKIPNGKVAASESEFGNAYRVTPTCAAVKTVDHHGHHTPTPVCDAIFNEGVFKLGQFVVDIDNYRQACAHAVASRPNKAEEEACRIAFAYTAALRSAGLLFVRVPKQCAICNVDGEKRKLGEEFTVNLPQRQADIVLGIELSKSNEQIYKELIVPVVSQLVDELKAKKIDNVKVHLIGISTKLPYPIQYDIENNKLKGAKIHFTDPKRTEQWNVPVVTKNEPLDNYIRILTNSIQTAQFVTGRTNTARAINNIVDLPLRPNAVKSLVLFIGDNCPATLSPARLIYDAAFVARLYAHGFVVNIFTPTPELDIDGGDVKQIVGFGDDSVVLLNGEKGADVRKTLKINRSLCTSASQFTNGNVFSLSNFNALAAPQKKQFTQRATHSIVDSLVNRDLVTECTCELKHGLTPYSDCVIRSIKEAKQS